MKYFLIMYPPLKLILKYISVLQKAENQYASFVHVFSFKATHPDLVNYLYQLHMHVDDNQKRLSKIIKALHEEVPEQSADGLKGIFKEGYYMIDGEHDAYTVDSIIALSVVQAGYYKLNYYYQLLTYLKKTHQEGLGHVVENIIEEEERLLEEIQQIQMLFHKKAIINPILNNLVL